MTGDGTGGTEKYLKTTTSKEDCESHVLATEGTANGATWGPSNKKCYAEYGMTGHNTLSDWMTCTLIKGTLLGESTLALNLVDVQFEIA